MPFQFKKINEVSTSKEMEPEAELGQTPVDYTFDFETTVLADFSAMIDFRRYRRRKF